MKKNKLRQHYERELTFLRLVAKDKYGSIQLICKMCMKTNELVVISYETLVMRGIVHESSKITLIIEASGESQARSSFPFLYRLSISLYFFPPD